MGQRTISQDAEIEPVPTSASIWTIDPEMEQLSQIIRPFNEQFGNIDWKDRDKIEKVVAEEIPAKVAANKAYQNAQKNSDKENARIEHDKALAGVITDML